jgi:hypothetical protein
MEQVEEVLNNNKAENGFGWQDIGGARVQPSATDNFKASRYSCYASSCLHFYATFMLSGCLEKS